MTAPALWGFCRGLQGHAAPKCQTADRKERWVSGHVRTVRVQRTTGRYASPAQKNTRQVRGPGAAAHTESINWKCLPCSFWIRLHPHDFFSCCYPRVIHDFDNNSPNESFLFFVSHAEKRSGCYGILKRATRAHFMDFLLENGRWE